MGTAKGHLSSRIILGRLAISAALLTVLAFLGCQHSDPTVSDSATNERVLTFNKDVAPIIFKQCGTCHHPDGSGPFSLLTYEDVRKRARQIGEVTRSRYMPPWLPAHGYGEFIGERRLSDDEIETIGSWVSSGAVEGAPADLPPVPQWPGGWQLGEPDLILKIPEPYTLAAEGRDVYRQFVLPTGLTTSRYVRATEIRPGNPKIAHHAIINLDPTGYAAKQEDEKDSPPGFDGMGLSDGHGLESPGGQYIVWTPGMIADGGSADMAWTLEPGTDLVLEIHMAPSGKPEVIQPVVGLYFSDQPPTKYPVQLRLDPSPIDIPAGESEYSVTDSMVLPVDVELLAIFPHAHYLCKVMKCVAVLPDGKRKWLLNIPDWDFDWQDDYTYAEPVLLPSGTTVSMEFIYDNSAENPHNPNDPPRRVLEGPQSTDEMSNVSLQFLPQSPGDGQQLKELYWRRGIQRVPGYYYAHFAAGVHSMVQGKFAQARVDYENCLALNPQFIQARFNLAHVYLQLKEFDLAILQYQSVLGSDPGNALAHSNLGRIFDQKRDPSRAATHYRRAIENDPNLFEPHNRLGVILARQGSYSEAAKLFARAVQINPDHSLAHVNLANAYLLQKQYALAITHYNEALRIDPKDKEAQTNLSRARAALKTN